jgi:class 3 adenylate cyclase/predicted ATPase
MNLARAKYCSECGHRLARLGFSARPPSFGAASQRTQFDALAERRQMTVMLYDLVSSTSVASSLDPEDLRDVIGAFHRCVRDEVMRFGGFVARYMGDGGLIYFGYPQAHEDDAERSIHAGLAAIDAVSRLVLFDGYKPQIRIGIATGLVVVGDIVGAGSAPERDIVGQTPNLAARLQAIADPGTLVISSATRRVTGRLFEYLELGPLMLKGFSEPLSAWRVLGVGTAETRFEAQREVGLTPLVGREAEIEELVLCWQRARAGQGHVVALSGDSGIGKSRIAAMLLARLAPEQHTRQRYFCSQHHGSSPFYPSIKQLERAAGIVREDTPVEKLKKLETALIPEPRHDETVSLLADLLSIPVDDRYPKLQLTPARRRERTMEALLSQFELLSQRRPLVAVFEDAHWIDPTSLDLLNRAVERIGKLPILLIVTFRPEFLPSWARGSHITSLTLNPLTQREAILLVEKVAGKGTLPADLVADIVERGDGVPLFLEELTNAVLEAGSGDQAGEALITRVAPRRDAVPATLHAPLMARLDRLGAAAKDVAQIGAALGREFSYDLIANVSQTREAELRAALARLSDAGLVFCRGTPPDSNYTFKHALVQDAAYSTLLRSRRQDLHAAIGRVLEDRFPETVGAQPEIVAQHYTKGGLVDPAIEYWRKAGEHALTRSAITEAIAHLTCGLQLVSSLPCGSERDHAELALQVALGSATRAGKGHSAPETLRVFARARELLGVNSSARERVLVFNGLWGVHLIRGEQTAARDIAAEWLMFASSHGSADALAIGNLMMGASQWAMGDFLEGRKHLEQVLVTQRNNCESLASTGFSLDNRVAALSYLAMVLWQIGYAQQSAVASLQALKEARGNGNAFTLTFALGLRTLLSAGLRADWCQAVTDADQSLAHSAEHGFPLYERWARFYQGAALAESGNPQHGIDIMRGAMASAARINAGATKPVHFGRLAIAYDRLGQPKVGLELLDEAIPTIEKTQERFFEAELYRIRGELLLNIRKKKEGEAALQHALMTARKQQARMWELRSAASLARLWRDQGRANAARDLLAPIFGWFTEGFDTPDLKEAKKLLEELAQMSGQYPLIVPLGQGALQHSEQ